MSSYVEVIAVVEGRTEQTFVEYILAKYLGQKNIGIKATQVSKPGQKGGDVRFDRVKDDLGLHLKQRRDTYVTTIIDYYGTKDWPGYDDIPPNATPVQIANIVNTAAKNKIVELFGSYSAEKRFIPNMAIHEFEAYLFSAPDILANKIGVKVDAIEEVIRKCGEPESVNNSPLTAPSKRLAKWCGKKEFPKTSLGIAIAEELGIDVIRGRCPVFNSWLTTIESLLIKINRHGTLSAMPFKCL